MVVFLLSPITTAIHQTKKVFIYRDSSLLIYAENIFLNTDSTLFIPFHFELVLSVNYLRKIRQNLCLEVNSLSQNYEIAMMKFLLRLSVLNY